MNEMIHFVMTFHDLQFISMKSGKIRDGKMAKEVTVLAP